MTDRVFYKTIITIEVLSEDPIPDGMSVENIAKEAMEGSYSMQTLGEPIETVLNGKEAADALLEQGSDSSFFQLTEDGNDVE